MRDPFPIPPIPALSAAVQPWADYFHLPTLPLHIHEILITAAFYHFVAAVLSPALSKRWFPKEYAALSRSRRLNWDVHVVSLVQATTINALALWVMYVDVERSQMDRQERLWGYTGGAAMIQAFATGYFLWDLLMTAANLDIFGLGFLAHAVSALVVYSFGFRPFVNFYSCNFILWELSTMFLNIHWFFDKLGMTGSKAQLYNGIMLILTFFSVRLIWGTSQSYAVGYDIWIGLHQPPVVPATAVPDQLDSIKFPAQYADTMRFVTPDTRVPIWLAGIYTISNLTLNSLNFYWFFKIIEAVYKRFDSGSGTDQSTSNKADDQDNATTTSSDGQPAPLRKRRGTLLDGEDPESPPPT
ncbi:DUF887-domain-containing protein [Xylariaceae sp. FL0255]|nr:DUF887-domain-containing protein [Xylariaceae sp. FL0255]